MGRKENIDEYLHWLRHEKEWREEHKTINTYSYLSGHAVRTIKEYTDTLASVGLVERSHRRPKGVTGYGGLWFRVAPNV